MQRNLITSTGISRINAIDANRNDLIKQQNEASEVIRKITADQEDLQRKFDKKEKLVIEDRKVRD
jgi:hypothetical protein